MLPGQFVQAVWIIPSWGVFPWVMATCQPFWIKSAMVFAALATAAFCSGRLVPRASWPRPVQVSFLPYGSVPFTGLFYFSYHITFFRRVEGNFCNFTTSML